MKFGQKPDRDRSDLMVCVNAQSQLIVFLIFIDFLSQPDRTIELFVANCDRDYFVVCCCIQQLCKPESRFILYI